MSDKEDREIERGWWEVRTPESEYEDSLIYPKDLEDRFQNGLISKLEYSEELENHGFEFDDIAEMLGDEDD